MQAVAAGQNALRDDEDLVRWGGVRVVLLEPSGGRGCVRRLRCSVVDAPGNFEAVKLPRRGDEARRAGGRGLGCDAATQAMAMFHICLYQTDDEPTLGP